MHVYTHVYTHVHTQVGRAERVEAVLRDACRRLNDAFGMARMAAKTLSSEPPTDATVLKSATPNVYTHVTHKCACTHLHARNAQLHRTACRSDAMHMSTHMSIHMCTDMSYRHIYTHVYVHVYAHGRPR